MAPNRSDDAEEHKRLQNAHMHNINRMAENGQLVLAGPFLDDSNGMQGIYIFDVKTIEEAEALTATDPMIEAGWLEMELIPWYGSAAVRMINDYHAKMSKTPI